MTSHSSQAGLLTATAPAPPTAEQAAAPLPFTLPAPLTAQVERLAAEAPDRPAVRRGTRQWTYRDLADAAHRIASGLVAAGVGPGETVGVHGGRSFETVAALLGVMRARAVVLLLDPAHAPDRIRILLEEAGARTVVATDGAADGLDREVLRYGELAATEPAVLAEPAAQDPAYVIFTSGTTGRPKGVLGWHGALAHYVEWEQTRYGFGPHDRVAQIASFSFDAVLRDVFLALGCGATLSLPPTDRPFEDPEGLLAWFDAEGVTVVHTVPSVLASWLHAAQDTGPSLRGVRLLGLAGEPLTGALVRRWRARFPEFTGLVLNLYGTTEGTILQSCYEVPEDTDDAVLAVGTPIGDTQLLVLNRRGAPCGVGEPGEVVVRSPFLTRGYLEPATGSGFAANPFRRDPADRIYRTGDVGRFEADGTLFIAGRLDDQVKLRGVRVQPAEVAAALAAHPAVRQAATVARTAAGGGAELVGYVVLGPDAPGTWQQELRDLVAARVSTAAVPAHLLPLDALPLSPNGKLDHTRLPAPPSAAERPAGSQEPVTDPLEQKVAAVWARVLGLAPAAVPRERHFFELGGDSLTMVRVLSRLRRDTGADVGMQEFFRHPTVAALAAVARDSGAGAGGGDTITRRTRSGPLPLSQEQEGLWFVHQIAPDSFAYHMSGAFEVAPGTAVEDVERALTGLLRRHEALRTVFGPGENGDGRPVQTVLDATAPDLAVLPAAEDRAAALATLATAAAHPFDLARGPLLRARLVAEPQGLLLGLTVHHIVCDGWSWEVMAGELNASLDGRDPDVRPAPLGYGDYAVWQHEQTDGTQLERHLAFWTGKLADAPQLDLPLSRPRPARLTHHGRVRRFTIDVPLAAELDRFCHEHGFTRYTALLTAFGLLLSRSAYQDEVVVGVDSAGRDHSELEQTVGFFVRTHAVRMGFADSPGFLAAVQRVHDTFLEAYPHQDVPFSRIVEALNPERDAGRTPLFQVLFRMPPSGVGTEPATALHPVDLEGTFVTSKFDLTLMVRATEGGLVCELEYNTDLFDDEVAEALGTRYRALLAESVRAPRTPESALAVPAGREDGPDTPAEPRPRPRTEPVTGTRSPAPPSAHGLFAQAARRAPRSAAVREGEHDWTYAELADAVRALDAALPEHAVVAVLGGRDLASVAALLAATDRGRVAVPVDSSLPPVRRRQMLARAGVQLAVVVGEPDAALPVPTLHLGPDARFTAPPPDLSAIPACRVPDDAAYVFFTSGTTGEPKPVLGMRRSLDHFVDWERTEFAVGAHDRVAQLTSYSFDAVLRDVFLPLSSGGTVVLPAPAVRDDALRLLQWLESERITVLHTTPSVLGSLLAVAADADGVGLRALRLVCLAGEPLLDATVAGFRRLFADCAAKVVNFYGPTETTMIKSFFEVPAPPVPGVQPVGRPLPGTRIRLLGRDGRPCAPGERGEIVIDTPFGTLGYLAPPQEPGLLDVLPGIHGVPYRTGDIGLERPDGTFVAQGRRDGLLKIRGVRVHPAEIASAALTHPDVAACHVEAVAQDGGTQLVAFFSPREGTDVTAEALRRHLAERLAAPVVPGLLFTVPALPLLPNGKVDRRALLDRSRPAAGRRPAPPSTPTERALAQIWGALLQQDEPGVHDDFFEIGGHSLLATVMITRVRKQLGAQLTLRQVLEKPRIAELARAVDSARDEEQHRQEEEGQLVRLSHGPGTRPLFCVHGIGGDVLPFRALAAELGDGGPVLAFRAQGTVPGERPRNDIRQMAAAYLFEMRKAQPSGPYRIAGWSLGGLVAYEIARQLSFDGERTELLLLVDTYAPGTRAYDGFDGDARDRARSFTAELAGTGFPGDIPAAQSLLLPEGSAGAPDDELRRRFGMYLAHSTAAARYRPNARRLDVDRFLLVRATGQERPEGTSAALGWERFTGGEGPDVLPVDADHYSALRRPAVASFAGSLREARREN
ncbi:non-ribosomal peptide synthetase [Streptomyces sp. STR69]|uniref:non-ribosomal peptide synthetase n=1 Tax=Streptomyces sp. STR69 TaxID=1796942 RepID=UPI0021C6EAFB|nr:non-ribosomal peptide synthetase [Streptomyces sp. STR69]